MKITQIGQSPKSYYQTRKQSPKTPMLQTFDTVSFKAKKQEPFSDSPKTAISHNIYNAKVNLAFTMSYLKRTDDTIKGYQAQKQTVKDVFINQIALEKAGLKAYVPNSILFYGPIGTGKTIFARETAKKAGCELIEMSPEFDNFNQEVYEQLKNARTRYLKEGKRTVIIINDIEAYLRNTKSNHKNIAKMGNWLEDCARLPLNDTQNAYATTFFFTTNHPLEISENLLLNCEKISELIPMVPAKDNDIEQIIKFYIEKFNKNGKIINPDEIDFEQIIEKMNPDNEKGAFGNDKIKGIVQSACQDFNQDMDNKKSFEEYLNERINKAKRNISPGRLQQFREQTEELS